MRTNRDTSDLIIEQLQAILSPKFDIILEKEKPWASITFSGKRYRFALQCAENRWNIAIEQKIHALTEHEFELPGYFVADVLIHEKGSEEPFVTIEILIIADPVSEDGPAIKA